MDAGQNRPGCALGGIPAKSRLRRPGTDLRRRRGASARCVGAAPRGPADLHAERRAFGCRSRREARSRSGGALSRVRTCRAREAWLSASWLVGGAAWWRLRGSWTGLRSGRPCLLAVATLSGVPARWAAWQEVCSAGPASKPAEARRGGLAPGATQATEQRARRTARAGASPSWRKANGCNAHSAWSSGPRADPLFRDDWARGDAVLGRVTFPVTIFHFSCRAVAFGYVFRA